MAEALALASVLSGNRNFEGRINPDVRMNYLDSPPLVVAYALAGTMDIDLTSDRSAPATTARPCTSPTSGPRAAEVQQTIRDAVRSDMFTDAYGSVFAGDDRWSSLDVAVGVRDSTWDDTSTYVHRPPSSTAWTADPAPSPISSERACLAKLGPSRHHRPHLAGRVDRARRRPPADGSSITASAPEDFNSYGSRRGNHEVMIRGTFANVRLRNQLAPGTEGGVDPPSARAANR